MEPTSRRFSSDEVSNIVRRALDGTGGRDDVTYGDLEEIAREQGISPARLQAAIREQESEGDLEKAREQFVERLRDGFYGHLRAYLIVIGILWVMNFVTTGLGGYPWAIWPMLGWGFGIGFHAADTFFISQEKINKGARKILKKQERKRQKIEEAYDEL